MSCPYSCANFPDLDSRCEECRLLPQDYQPCGECGFDHAYEPEEANASHQAQAELLQNYDYSPTTGGMVRIRRKS